jgi:hypothetical protein
MKRVSLLELQPYMDLAKKEGLLFINDCDYYGLYSQNDLIAFCAIRYVGKHKAIFKCEYVLKQYRGNNILLAMINYRKQILKDQGIKVIEANCTSMSKNSHIKCGGKVDKVYKNGITKIVYENL